MTTGRHACERISSHHDSFQSKLACAKLLGEEAGIRRDILVDDLAGTVHRTYWLMPNMTWVIGRGGRIAYKANWTSALNEEAFLGRVPAHRPQAVRRASAPQRPRAAREFEKPAQLWARRPAP